MKKKLGLIIVSLLGFCAVGGACVSVACSNNPVVVFAEGEETFEQKTYVYEDDNGKATLVLLSETEFSMTVGEETKNGTYTKNGNILTLTLGESSIDVEVNDILGTFGEPAIVEEQEPEKIDEVKEWFDKWFSPQMVATYVAYASFVGVIIGLVANIKKLKQTNNLTLKNVSDEVQNKLAIVVSEKVAEQFGKIAPQLLAGQENANHIMSIFAKILALSQENTPEAKVAILNLIEELGTAGKELVQNAKQVVEDGKKLAEETKKEMDKKLDEIVDSYDGTSI